MFEITIAAPTGYGKTTLMKKLEQFLKSEGIAVNCADNIDRDTPCAHVLMFKQQLQEGATKVACIHTTTDMSEQSKKIMKYLDRK